MRRQPPTQETKTAVRNELLNLVQSTLCVPRGNTLDTATANAVRDYMVGIGEKAPTSVDLNNRILKSKLEAATDSLPDCRAAGFLNAYEVGAYGPSEGVDQTSKIEGMQKKLSVMLQSRGLQTPLTVSGQLDKQTRNAIMAVRGTSNQIDSSFDKELLRVRLRLQAPAGTTQPQQPSGAAPAATPPAGTPPANGSTKQ